MAAYVVCDLCNKEVFRYTPALCGRHVLCSMCAIVFKDGVSELPQCSICHGEFAREFRESMGSLREDDDADAHLRLGDMPSLPGTCLLSPHRVCCFNEQCNVPS